MSDSTCGFYAKNNSDRYPGPPKGLPTPAAEALNIHSSLPALGGWLVMWLYLVPAVIRTWLVCSFFFEVCMPIMEWGWVSFLFLLFFFEAWGYETGLCSLKLLNLIYTIDISSKLIRETCKSTSEHSFGYGVGRYTLHKTVTSSFSSSLFLYVLICTYVELKIQSLMCQAKQFDQADGR